MSTESGALRFTKVEGAGNDYVLVEGPIPDASALARAVSDRHAGVGSDGVLLLGPGSDGADATMRIFNADGSEGRMCGNGLRCVVRYLVERRGLGPDVLVDTASGRRSGRFLADGSVEVTMGTPSFAPDDLPCDLAGDGSRPPELNVPDEHVADPPRAFAVSTGNPHLVVRFGDVGSVDLASLGGALGKAPQLAEGANVHATSVVSADRLEVRPFELGSGATQACGTGAVAAAAVSRVLGWTDAERVTVEMPGGELSVRWPGHGEAWLGGPARLVFDGEWPDL